MTVLTANRRGEADSTSWYKIWEAANAAYYACISPGFRGTFRGLGTFSSGFMFQPLIQSSGDNHDLFVTFTGP